MYTHTSHYICMFRVLQVRDYIEKILDKQITGSRAPPPCVVEDNREIRQSAGKSKRSLEVAGRDLAEQALSLGDVPQFMLNIEGMTPAEAVHHMRRVLPNGEAEREAWRKQARVAAILGSCPKSRASMMSGIRNWIKFMDEVLGNREIAFPPRLEDILTWSHTFRCVGTFSNYLGHLSGACLAMELEMPSTTHPALQRAKAAVIKRMLWTARPRMFIQRYLMRNMVLAVSRGLETARFAMLWIAAYWFLLRVPSEALPMQRGEDESPGAADAQSILYLHSEDVLGLKLKTRKNKQQGSTLLRKCSCEACSRTCPVHVLWHGFFANLAEGEKPWADVSHSAVLEHLRRTLERLQVPDHGLYGTHDFRRGHAKDLQQSGRPIAELLAAGEWKSKAVKKYLDMPELERDVALEAAILSDNEEFID